MQNRQIDEKQTMQVLIDNGYHKEMKILAARLGMSIKELLEEGCVYVLDFYNDTKNKK